MSHTLHHYTWLLRRFRHGILLNVLVWSSSAFIAWGTTWGLDTGVDQSSKLHWLYLLPAMLLWLTALDQDPAAGNDTFWRTRPVRWRALFGSQSLFLLTAVAAPVLGVWFWNGLLLDNTAAQWCDGLWQTAILFCPAVLLAGVHSFCRSWYGLVGGLVALALLGAAVMYFSSLIRLSLSSGRSLPAWLMFTVNFLFPLTLSIVAWVRGLQTGRRRRRALVLASAIVAAPLAAACCFIPLQRGAPPAPVVLRQIMPSASGDRHLWGAPLEGVPAGAWPVFAEGSYGASDNSGGLVARQLPAAAFASLLPPETRWYHGFSVRQGPPSFSSARGRAPDLRGLGGTLFTLELPIAVRLESGATAARDGIRLRLRRLNIGDQVLSATVDIFSSTRTGVFSAPAAPLARLPESLVLLLHLPGANLAMIHSAQSANGQFRTLQTDVVTWPLTFPVPLVESLTGVAWNPETLREARLYLCRLRPVGDFTVSRNSYGGAAEGSAGQGSRAAELYPGFRE